jgi:hypothetical protein
VFLRHEYERDGVLVPPPWIVVKAVGMAALGIIGLFFFAGGMVWLHKNVSGWTVVALFVGIYGVICAAALLYQRVRRRRMGASQQQQPPPGASA